MKKVKKSIALFLVFAFSIVNMFATTFVSADEASTVTLATSEAILVQHNATTGELASCAVTSNTTDMNGAGVSANAYILKTTSNTTDARRLYLKFDVSAFEDWYVDSATLTMNLKQANSNASSLKIYDASSITGSLVDIPDNYAGKAAELNGIATDANLVASINTRGATSDSANGIGIKYGRSVDFNLKEHIETAIASGEDSVTLMLEFYNSSTAYQIMIAAAETAYAPTLSVTGKLDVPPEISGEEIVGTPVEGLNLTAKYHFDSDLHEEGESVIDWFCADSADGDNEEEIILDGGKEFHLDSEYVGKYIRARITPYSDGGFYTKNGKEHSNVYYTSYVGPVKSVAYLDELAAAISVECTDATELYNYLVANESIFELNIDELNSYTKKDQVLSNILANPPVDFADLKTKYTNEFITIQIEEAASGNIEDLLLQTDIDLSVYNELEDSAFILNSLEEGTFESYQDLESAFAKYVVGAQIKAETSSEKLAVMLANSASYFTFDIEGCTYGEMLHASKYLVEADKTTVTKFDELDSLISEAIEYGKENYTGGYITNKKVFAEEFCVKTDYSENTDGVNSIVAPAASYRLFGAENAEMCTQQLFFKLDISDLLEYHIQSVNISLYGTVGGGADKIVEIVSAEGFDSATDFLDRYPSGVSFVRGESLAQVKYSYGTTKWNKADITDYILEKAENGDEYVFLLIDYTGSSQGAAASKGATIYSTSSGEEKAPYVEIIYETPPVVKNIEIRGVKAIGSTLTAKYDYFGCYAEKDSVFKWYYADKNGDIYENKTPISQSDSSSLEIKPEYADKSIMVEIKPCSAEGAYTEGAFTPSEYTLPILNSEAVAQLVEELNSAADISTVFANEEKAQYLDLNIVSDMELLEADGKTKVLAILSDKTFTDLNHFKKYYINMINVQAINEAGYEEIDNLIINLDTGINTDRYVDFESNTSVLGAVYNKGFESVEAYQAAYNEACAVYEFNTVDHSNVQELLLAYDFMFSQDVSSYGSDKLELVGNFFMTEIQTKKGSFSNIQTALTKAVNSAENYTPSIKPSGGGGGTGGGSKDKEIQVPPSSETGSSVTVVVPANVFKDQDGIANWAKDSVLKLSAMGIISGDENGNFRPDDNITREEFLKIVVTAFDIKGNGTANFEDVDKKAWYSEYIDAAVSAGIINGIGDNKFGTGMYISREDMSVILYRVLSAKSLIGQTSSLNNFDDSAEVADYAEKAISTLVKYGIINGVGDNKFAPKSNSTRAMVAVMACRALEIHK